MRAVVLEDKYSVKLLDVPEPQPKAGEVIVEMEKAAVCGSDVAFFTGKRIVEYPLILGHEGVGVVIAAGEGVNQSVLGQRVVLEPNIPCGVCQTCSCGHGNVCPEIKKTGVNIPGCFAEKVAISAEYAWPIPKELDWKDAVTIEPLAVAAQAVRLAEVQPGDSLLVIGSGNEGLLMTLLASEMGVNVSVVDKSPKRLEMAKRFGAQKVYQPEELENSHEVCSAVIEAAGVSATVEMAIRLVGRGGRVVLVGLSATPVNLVPIEFVRKGIQLKSSMIYDHIRDFGRTVNLVCSGGFSSGRVVEELLPLEETVIALEKSSSGLYGKFVLDLKGKTD